MWNSDPCSGTSRAGALSVSAVCSYSGAHLPWGRLLAGRMSPWAPGKQLCAAGHVVFPETECEPGLRGTSRQCVTGVLGGETTDCPGGQTRGATLEHPPKPLPFQATPGKVPVIKARS